MGLETVFSKSKCHDVDLVIANNPHREGLESMLLFPFYIIVYIEVR